MQSRKKDTQIMDKDRESKNERAAGPKLSRRKFLAICAGAVVLAGGGWAFSRTQLADRLASHALGAAQGKPVLSYLRQVIAADNAHARTIMWHSDVKWQDAVVEYRLKGAKAVKGAMCFMNLWSAFSETRQFHATLKQLMGRSSGESDFRS